MTDASALAFPRPDLPKPPQSIIDAAKRTTPDTLTRMPNDTRWGAQNPGAGHRVVLAAQLVEQLSACGHNPAAAEWGVYQLIEAGLLVARPGVKETRPVIGHRPDENDIRWKARRFYGEGRWKTIPVYGEAVREVVNDRWFVNSTDALWKWWRDSWPGGDSTGATASSAADLPVSPGIKAMSDDAILRACFDELLERLADRGDALDVFHSPCVEQLNRVAKSLGFEALIFPRYLKKGPNVGRHWAVMDPGTSEIADRSDYDAIAVDVIDPFSRGTVRRIVIAAGMNKLCEANPDATADLKAMLRRWIKCLQLAPNMVQSAPAPLSVAALAPPSADDLMTARRQATSLLSAAGTARMSARTLTRDSRRPSPDERDRFVESARLLRESYFAVAPEGVPVRARQWEKLRPFWELDGEQITDAGRTDRTAHDLVLYLAAETLGAVGTLISPGEHRDPWIWEAAMAKAAALPEIDQHKLGALLHREHDRGVRRITPTPAGSVGEDGSVELSGSPAPLPTPPPSTSDTTRTCATFPAEWKDPRRCPGCHTPVPDGMSEFAQHFTCRQCQAFRLHTSAVTMPVGKEGERPAAVRTAVPYWQPCDPPASDSDPAATASRSESKLAKKTPRRRGPKPRYDPAADQAYLDRWADAQNEGKTALQFEEENGDDAGTVEKTQARVRNRRRNKSK